MIAYLFPGQGSQKKGMGGNLFDEFKDLTATASDILGYSIKELCLEDPQEQLSQTQYTQPGLFVVNALSYLKKVEETGKKPDYVAGHSVGEYNALFAAGVFDFETGLKLVKKRGELMSMATGGGMAAVIGLKAEIVEKTLAENGFKSIDMANYNSPSQIVISGPKADIESAKPIFEAAGAIMYVILKVSGAFHSRYMVESRNEFEKFITQFKLSAPTIPVISNLTARPYKQSDLIKNIVDQLTNSVLWNDSIRYLMGKGVTEMTEIGPGTVLTGLVRSIQREAKPLLVADEETEPENNEPKEQDEKRNMTTPISSKNCQKENETQVQGQQPEQVQNSFPKITAFTLGNEEFKQDYNLKYAYLTGAMYKGIASKEMVVRMGKAGMMGFFGAGGLQVHQLEENIQYIQKELNDGQAYGMNLIHQPTNPEREEVAVDLYLKYGVPVIEASAFMSITPSLVRYRAKGLKRDQQGEMVFTNRIIAKVSRPEVAEAFLSPPPERVINRLVNEGKITAEEAGLVKEVPMADELCVEADSGGHTDAGVAFALLPAMIKLRDRMMNKHGFSKQIRVGAAGGIGTPAAAAAAFILGADFILTGSINQCTVEAGTSDAVKELLQKINVQDTDYAPAGDMFEMGAKVQVLKKGVLFPARAKRLYELYRQYKSLDEIDETSKKQVQENYFKRSFEEVYEECKAHYPAPAIEEAERNPKQKMTLLFRWYFHNASSLALTGDEENKVNYQVHCGPALGSFNQWVKGTPMEDWRNRHVDEMGEKIMAETAELLNRRFRSLLSA